MRPELVPISKLLDQMRDDQRKLEKSHEQLMETSRKIAALFESLSNEVKRAPARPMDARRLQLDQQYLQLQAAMQRENAVFTSVSNVLKTRHDTAKNSISNIR